MIRPCPFCKSADIVVRNFPGHPHFFQAGCRHCGARGPREETEDLAMKAWQDCNIRECIGGKHDWVYPYVVLKSVMGESIVNRYCLKCGKTDAYIG